MALRELSVGAKTAAATLGASDPRSWTEVYSFWINRSKFAKLRITSRARELKNYPGSANNRTQRSPRLVIPELNDPRAQRSPSSTIPESGIGELSARTRVIKFSGNGILFQGSETVGRRSWSAGRVGRSGRPVGGSVRRRRQGRPKRSQVRRQGSQGLSLPVRS